MDRTDNTPPADKPLSQCSPANQGATLYLTHTPCRDCSKLVLQSGIKRVVYKEAYKDPAGIDFLRNAGLEMVHINDIDE